MKTIAIFGNQYKMEIIDDVIGFLSLLIDRKNVSLHIEESFASFLSLPDPLQRKVALFSDPRELSSPDMAIALGGDGTILRTIHLFRNTQVPLLAINCGRLGFLTDVDVQEACRCVDRIVEGDYRIERRSLLSIRVNGELLPTTALNEVAIQKRETGSMIMIDTYIDGEYLSRYDADGLIIATPSGSTAYSLSLHGPIVFPSCRNLLLTPIAPHSLNIRPIVISDESTIRVSVSSRSQTFALSVDGRLLVFPCDTTIEVSRSSQGVHLIRLSEHSFTYVLREKLHWGSDPRKSPSSSL